MFLINVGVSPFRKNHNKNPSEPTKNLAKQTEKSIKNHYKPCKNRLRHKKRYEIKTMKEILQNWDALKILVFLKQNDQKTYNNVELKKTEIFPLGLCALHVETKGELNK